MWRKFLISYKQRTGKLSRHYFAGEEQLDCIIVILSLWAVRDVFKFSPRVSESSLILFFFPSTVNATQKDMTQEMLSIIEIKLLMAG